MVEDYIKNKIDSNAKFESWDGQSTLSISLLASYSFQLLTILDRRCLLAEPVDPNTRVEFMFKHATGISESTKMPLVFLFKNLSDYKRKLFFSFRLPFIVENGQLYLPFLALDIYTPKRPHVIIDQDKFPPMTQLVYLYFLYNEKATLDIAQTSKLLNLSAISASRALTYLFDKKLLTCQKTGFTGRRKIYQRISGSIYYSMGKDFLQSPVSRRTYLPYSEQSFSYLKSGLEAIADLSMINPPVRPVRAIGQREFESLKPFEIVEKDITSEEDLVELQIWKYAPELLSSGPCVDVISMIQSVSERDERIEKAILSILEETTWYTG